MKQFITHAVIALFVLCGAMLITQTCSAAAYGNASYANYNYNYNYNPYNYNYGYPYNYGSYQANYPPVGTQAPHHHVTPTQMRTGYTRQEIRSMPMVARPSRPGHFIGNTVRRRAGTL